MTGNSLHIMIIGGGLGGLCLAQGLKKAGISVAVYERDRTNNERSQGYRVHIEAMGNRALYDCLPPHLFEIYLRITGRINKGLLLCDEQLHSLMEFSGSSDKSGDLLKVSRSVNRANLHRLLLTELDDIVRFDRYYSHYQAHPDGSVTAFFEDGSEATGDLLVAADGGNSRIRQQFLPQASRVETGAISLIGKIPLTSRVYSLLTKNQLDRSTLVLGPGGRGLFSALHDLSGKISAPTRQEMSDSQASTMFENTDDYYFWAFITKQKNYALRENLQQLPGDRLLPLVQSMVGEWHTALQHLIDLTRPDTVIATPLRIATPVTPWESQNITLLGDAIHSMPPTRGIGGNTALGDAQLLCQKLSAVSQQEQTLSEALREYVEEMLISSFAAVKSSKQSLDMILSVN